MTSTLSGLQSEGEALAATEALPASQRTPVAPVPVGDVVAGKYRIEGVIGFGGMGVVCGATHLELHTSLAVKFVRPERGVDERAVARFLTEARAAAQLASPHVCRVIDCGRLPTGTPYLVMERLVGADLHAVLARSGPLPIADAVRYALQACAALAEAHAKGIVHRDIKPENLFLTEGPSGPPYLKVLDFGISKQEGAASAGRWVTGPTEIIGSPFYMSPEQMTEPSGVDARTDVWSLGVVLYEHITGQLPFAGDSTPQLCANVMTVRPIPLEQHRTEIPGRLSRAIMRCLEKDRSQRFRNVAELMAELKPFELEAEPAPESVSEAFSGIPGVPRRGSGLRLSVALVVLGAGALAAFALSRALRHDEVLPPPPPPAVVQPAGSAEPLPPAAAPSQSAKSHHASPSKHSGARPPPPRPAPSVAAVGSVIYPSVPPAPVLPDP